MGKSPAKPSRKSTGKKRKDVSPSPSPSPPPPTKQRKDASSSPSPSPSSKKRKVASPPPSSPPPSKKPRTSTRHVRKDTTPDNAPQPIEVDDSDSTDKELDNDNQTTAEVEPEDDHSDTGAQNDDDADADADEDDTSEYSWPASNADGNKVSKDQKDKTNVNVKANVKETNAKAKANGKETKVTRKEDDKSSLAPVKEEPTKATANWEGPLVLNFKRLFHFDHLDKVMSTRVTKFNEKRETSLIDQNEIEWSSTQNEVSPIVLSGIVQELKVDLAFMHRVMRLMNTESWTVHGVNVLNPLTMDASILSVNDFGTLSVGNQDAIFGLVGYLELAQPTEVHISPIVYCWQSFTGILARVIGTDLPLGFFTSKESNLILKRSENKFKSTTPSPQKKGRVAAPVPSAPKLYYRATSSFEKFDVEKPANLHGLLSTKEVVLVTFTAKKWVKEEANRFWLSPSKVIVLPH